MAIQFLPIISSQAATQAARFLVGSAGDATSSRPAIGIDISSNMRQFQKSLNSFERKQLPFAMMRTINDTLFSVRKQIVTKTYPRAFSVRDKRFASNAFRVEKASKRKLEGRVYDRLDRANLYLHATGGIKRAKTGSLAIPSRYVKDRRTGRGIRKTLLPREVLSTPKGHKAKGRGGNLIFQEYGPKGSKRRLLYTLKPAAKIDKRFMFYEDAKRTADRKFNRQFKVNFRKALKTARR